MGRTKGAKNKNKKDIRHKKTPAKNPKIIVMYNSVILNI